LGWAGLVLEVVAEPFDELAGEARVDVVDATHGLLRMPRGAGLAPGIAGVEQSEQLGAALVVEPFVGLGQQPAGPVERIVLAAPVAEGLVLDAAADLVEALVRQLD